MFFIGFLTFNHRPPQALYISNNMASQANQIYYQDVYRSQYLMGQTRYTSKSWVFKSYFSFKVRQHGQQQLYIQYRVCWILYKRVGAPSFSQPYLFIQPPLQSPPKISFSTSVNFHLAISPLFFYSISLQFPLTLPFFLPQQLFTSLFSRTIIPAICIKNIFLLQPFSKFRLRQSTKELRSLVWNDSVLISPFFLKDSDNRADNHWFLIAQAQKIGVLQVVVSNEDVCNWNDKRSNPPSLVPSTYCHYIHTLLIPSQEVTFLNLYKLIFILSLAFSYSIHGPLHPYV